MYIYSVVDTNKRERKRWYMVMYNIKKKMKNNNEQQQKKRKKKEQNLIKKIEQVIYNT